jgi:hypothetical protein
MKEILSIILLQGSAGERLEIECRRIQNNMDDFEAEIRRRRNERARRRKKKLEDIEQDFEQGKVKQED